MPELPDITAYIQALRPRVVGRRLEGVRLHSPFLLHSVDPPLDRLFGREVHEVSRLGKRIVFHLEPDLYLVLHLMIAGRLKWADAGAGRGAGTAPTPVQVPVPKKVGLAAFDFDSGTLVLTEAGSKRRATLHAAAGPAALKALDPGGLEPLECGPEAFAAALTRENHTLKRALTDPRLFSGIGNAYSDEILFAARLSPMRLTQKLAPEEVSRLYAAVQETLTLWARRLTEAAGDGFPTKVTAFHPEMAVHGKYKAPCPRCGHPVQRIAYASNETNYCAACQTGGKLLSDRAFARLLKQDWPKTIEALELHWQRLSSDSQTEG